MGMKGFQKRIGSRPAIRNALLVCGLLVAIFAPAVIANTCSSGGGQGSAVVVEKEVEERLFTTSAFELKPGLAIVEMTHQGEGSFVVDLLPAERESISPPEQIEFSGRQEGGDNAKAVLALADRTGPVDISRAVRITDTGDHVFEVKADGPWTVDVEQPNPSDAPQMTSFSGDDDTATPFFWLASGSKEVTMTSPAGGELEVSLLDKDGNEVAPVSSSEAGRASGEPSAPSTVHVPEDGIYLFDVRADNLWTVEFSDS
jgi:hypothetical protein